MLRFGCLLSLRRINSGMSRCLNPGGIMHYRRYRAWRSPSMKLFAAASFALLIGLATIAREIPNRNHAARPRIVRSAMPIPLCSPDSPDCPIGGQ
jgi:hypothetical protein